MIGPHLLLGPASIDRWVDEGRDLPGGGALNMAYHWSRRGVPFGLITRVGSEDGDTVLDFMRRNDIPFLPSSTVAPGHSAAIDVVIGEDRQPHMDHFVEGVWRSFQLTAEEDVAVRNATTLHAVLVDPVAAEVHRLGDTGLLDNVRVSGDFLDLRHYSLDRFAATMQHLALGFVGWPGDPDDPVVHGLRSIAEELGRTLVITLGSRGVLLVVGATTRFVPVSAVQVTGTTVGCGDSFIAAFLAELHLGGTIDEALDAGRAAGAAATTWLRPLPDEAYAPTTR
ncbi:MAG TPA: carbohydrate kinase family protein [Ilumatobacteraceae bacterium]|nr:carbohydrate kinase family protein [Ilumatobacteraceae bacterium]